MNKKILNYLKSKGYMNQAQQVPLFMVVDHMEEYIEILQSENEKKIKEVELSLFNEKLNSESLQRYWNYEKTTLSELQLKYEELLKEREDYAINFLDSIREYEKESHNSIYKDERTSSELHEIFKNSYVFRTL